MIRDPAIGLLFAVLLGACSGSGEPLGPNDPSEAAATAGDDDRPLGDASGNDADTDSPSDADYPSDTDHPGDTDGGDTGPDVCNALDAQQDRCGTWTERDKRDACDMADEQAQCIADVLVELEARGTSSCVYPHAMKAVCVGGQLTNIAVAKCLIEECLELTTADACLGNLDILCDYLP